MRGLGLQAGQRLVLTIGESVRDGDSESLFPPDRTHAQQLAESLALPVEVFVSVFGADWWPAPDAGHDFDADPSGSGLWFGPWFASGEPMQLMMRPHDDHVELAAPGARFVGSEMVVLEPTDHRRVERDGHLLARADLVVKELLRKRRATFRYCRYCRALTAPEGRAESDVCYTCAMTWLGVVH